MKKYVLLSFFFVLILALPCYANQLDERQIKPNTFTTPSEVAALIADATSSIEVNQTVTVQAGENLTPGMICSIINEGGVQKAYNNPLTVSTSPNGSESVFNAATTTDISAVALDNTRFIIIYTKADGNSYSKVGTVSGSSISWGTESNKLENVASYRNPACLISANKIIVFYQDFTNNLGRMVVLSISGNAITVGSPVTFQNSTCTAMSCSAIDSDKAIVTYYNSATTKGRAKIVTVSSTTPTPYPDATTDGTEFNNGSVNYISVSALSSTSAIVAYQDGGNSNYGTAQVLSISGTTITPGTEYVFNSVDSQYIHINKVSSSTAFLSYTDGVDLKIYSIIPSISGTTISYGSKYVVDNSNTAIGNNCVIDATHALIQYSYLANNYCYSKIANISGSVITYDTAYTVNAGATNYEAPIYLSSAKVVLSYRDIGNSQYGTSVVNTWATINYSAVSGISQGAYSSGSDAVVLISGTYDGLSSLIPGSPYFVNASFELQTTPVSLTSTIYSGAATTREIHFGTAKSSTEIILNIDYR